MFKRSIVFIKAYLVLLLLIACEPRVKTVEVKGQPLQANEQITQLDANDNIAVDQEVKVKSAMEKISPDVLASLDLITGYDKEAWWAPEKWDEELWAWKILLKWDQECDYGPGVSEYSLKESKYTFIVVQCAGGAYQPLSYTYLLDQETEESIQLKLGSPVDGIKFDKTISGTIQVNADTNGLSILSVSRGSHDCGVFRKFDFVEGDTIKTSNFVVKVTRTQECLVNPADIERLPYSMTDYESWPLVDE